jgi:tRNA(adenine34) deaminase
MWNTLSNIWKVCLEEAWDAYISGSVPIGAVITDPNGEIVVRERNRIFDVSGPPSGIFNNPLAHAEINAILSMNDKNIEPKFCVLYSTIEPCPLCIGAIAVAGIKKITYATPEPHAGSVNLLKKNAYLRQKSIKVMRETRVDLTTINYLLVAEFYWELNNVQTERVMSSWNETIPNLVKQSERIFHSGLLSGLKTNRASIVTAIDVLSKYYLIDQKK